MHRRGFLQLTQYDDRGCATFYTTGMEHSPTSATRQRLGANAVARDAAGGTGGAEEGWRRCLNLVPSRWQRSLSQEQQFLRLSSDSTVSTGTLRERPDVSRLLGFLQSDIHRVGPNRSLRTPLPLVPLDQKLRRVRPAERESIVIEGAE